MKRLIAIALIGLTLAACKTEPNPYETGDDPAVSAALNTASPPEGWEIVWDFDFNYAPRHLGFVWDDPRYISKSRFAAVVSAWKIKLQDDQWRLEDARRKRRWHSVAPIENVITVYASAGTLTNAVWIGSTITNIITSGDISIEYPTNATWRSDSTMDLR